MFILISFCGIASAATINVNNSTSNAIGNAVNTANPGDTLNLSAGNYFEHDISLNKNLTITGPETTSGNEPTAVIDAQNLGRIFYIPTGTKVTLKYLNIQNGKISDIGYGGGIWNEGTLDVYSCNIKGNVATFGGGICNTGTLNVLGSSIKNNIGTSCGGGIWNNNSVILTGSILNSNTGFSSGGGIWNENPGVVNISNCSLNNNSSDAGGGGIYNNNATLTVANSVITKNNTSDGGFGGGIYSYNSSLSLNSTTINCNFSGFGGGINNDNSNLTITNTNINNNIAIYDGGGISNRGSLIISGCNLEFNKASRNGNAIYNSNGDVSNRIIHFSRFFNPQAGYEIYNSSGSMDTMYNWWGSNADPSSKVYGTVDVNPWLILNINRNPSIIGAALTSTITVDISKDSDGGNHNLVNGPNLLPIYFSTTLGNINSYSTTMNGLATVKLTAGSTAGIAKIYAILDNQIAQTKVTIEITSPTVTGTNPSAGSIKVARNKIITITFNENIKAGSNYWIELVSSTGKSISITKSINGKVLTIKHSALLAANTKYYLKLHTGCITDLAGNPMKSKVISFTSGSS